MGPLHIECKALDFAKTYGEIARQLFDFKGQKNSKGKNDRLLKHVRRVEVLNENKERLSKFIGFDLEKEIKGYVVYFKYYPNGF